jgi:hypothetical protein
MALAGEGGRGPRSAAALPFRAERDHQCLTMC